MIKQGKGFIPLETIDREKKDKMSLTGFTFIELLIVSSICAVIMVTVYFSLSTGLFGYKGIEENNKICQSARQIMDRLNKDIRNSFFYIKEDTRFMGKQDELSFLALADSYSLGAVTQDYAFISYKLLEGKLLRLCRRGQDALNDKSQVKPEELLADVEEINFSYGSVAGFGQPIEWRELWDDPKILPVAVKVKLVIKAKVKQTFERTIFLLI